MTLTALTASVCALWIETLPSSFLSPAFCYLDSKYYAVIMYFMRTTVTIDADTEHLLKEEAARTGNSFKVVLNEAIRHALSRPTAGRIQVGPVFSAPFPPEFEEMSMNRLADELDDEETLRELTR